MLEPLRSDNLSNQYTLLQQEYQKLSFKYDKLKCKYNECSKNEDDNESFTCSLLRLIRNLYNNNKYSDITFKLKNYSIPGHKFVLEANNVNFDTVENEIHLEDLERYVAEQVIKWLYTQEVNTNQKPDNLWKIVETCENWNVLELKDRCGRALITTVTYKNCIEFFMKSSKYNVEELRKYCAEFIKTNWSNYTAFDFESLSGSIFLDLLEQKTSYPLHEAVRFNRDDVVYLFLNRHFSELEELVNEIDEEGDLLLDLALKTGRVELCETLLKNCANINVQHPITADTLLHKAISRCDVFSAMFLINNECHLNSLTSGTYRTPLQLLALLKKSQVGSVVIEKMNRVGKALIDAGADVNHFDSTELTALSMSVMTHNYELLTHILESNRCTCINGGQNYTILSKSYDSLNHSLSLNKRTSTISNPPVPLWLAICMEYRRDLLSEYEDIIDYSIENSNESNIIELLLNNGSELSTIINGQNGNTLLLEVIENQIDKAAYYLIDWYMKHCSTKININNNNKKNVLCIGNYCRETPLHIAVEKKMIDVVHILLESNADANIPRRKIKKIVDNNSISSLEELSDSSNKSNNNDGGGCGGTSVKSEPVLDQKQIEEPNSFESHDLNSSLDHNPFKEFMGPEPKKSATTSRVLTKSETSYSVSLPNCKDKKFKIAKHQRTGSSDSSKLLRKIAIANVEHQKLSRPPSSPEYYNHFNDNNNNNNNNNNNQIIDCSTPAHLAIQSTNQNLIDLFIKYDSKVDWLMKMDGICGIGNHGESVFTLLLWTGFMDGVERVYKKYIATKNFNGNHPLDSIRVDSDLPLLHQAIVNNKLNAVKFIVSVGADINIRSSDGLSPIHRAVILRHLPIVTYLTTSSANLDLTYSSYDTKTKKLEENVSPLWTALLNDQLDIARVFVLAKCDLDLWCLDSNTGYMQTQLHRAITNRMEDIAIFLIKNGCDCQSPMKNTEPTNVDLVSVTSSSTNPFGDYHNDDVDNDDGDTYIDGDTPLHMACRLGLLCVTKELLNKLPTPYVSARNCNQSTPLHVAVEQGYRQKQLNPLISVLINAMSQQNCKDALSAKNKRGHTAFHIAMATANQVAAKEILMHEPNAANETDNKGRNFLHVAVESMNMEAVCFLISVNVDFNVPVRDNTHYTPLQLAVITGSSENMIRSLILAGARTDCLTVDKKSLLHLAVVYQRVELIDCLIDYKCSVSHADSAKNTPLHLVMQIGHREILEKLLPIVESCITLRNLRGENCLHMLAKHANDNAIVLFTMLCQAYPDYPIDDRDASGNTPLLLAALSNNVKLGVALVSKGASLGCVNNDNKSLFNCKSEISTKLLVKLLETLDREPSWADGEYCVSCISKFTIKNRKHHCRHCGRLICGKCSDHELAIIKYNIKKPVRVCDICFDFLINGTLQY